MLDGEDLEKYLFVTIMNEKILIFHNFNLDD